MYMRARIGGVTCGIPQEQDKYLFQTLSLSVVEAIIDFDEQVFALQELMYRGGMQDMSRLYIRRLFCGTSSHVAVIVIFNTGTSDCYFAYSRTLTCFRSRGGEYEGTDTC